MGEITDFFRGLVSDPAKAAATATGLAALYGSLKPDSSIGQFMGAGSRQQPVGYTGGIPEYKVGRSLVPGAFATTTGLFEPRRPGSGGRRYFTDTTYTPTGKTMSAAPSPVGGTRQSTAGSASTTLPNFNALSGSVAEQLRKGTYTPATAAVELNKRYPGYNMTEESLVFELLNRGETTPQEVANYYAGRGYTPAQVLSRYQQLGGTRAFARGGIASLAPSRGYYLGGATDGMADEIPATIEATEPAALSDGEFVIPADVVSHLGNGNSDAGAKMLYSMMDRIRQARTGRKEQGRRINPNKYLPA